MASVSQCPELATIYTITTDYATVIIDTVSLEVNTGSLTVLGAKRTILALIYIETDFQPRETREEGEHRSHRTDCITIGTATAPSQDKEHHQRYCCNHKHRVGRS